MKLLIESTMIFFGTLMAAGLVALGEPGVADRSAGKDAAAIQAIQRLVESLRATDGWHE